MLYYCKTEQGNFGDDLNPWLLPRLAPDLCSATEPAILVAIGTIISSRLPPEPIKFIWGAGWSGTRLPRTDQTWKFYCVRGPLTAKALRLSADLAVTDPAMIAGSSSSPLR
jgi:succinoglycan biosynthesis protein ExoV